MRRDRDALVRRFEALSRSGPEHHAGELGVAVFRDRFGACAPEPSEARDGEALPPHRSASGPRSCSRVMLSTTRATSSPESGGRHLA